MISKGSVLIAQNKWAQGLINIGKESADIKKASDLASQFINDLYAYETGTVLFKPLVIAFLDFLLISFWVMACPLGFKLR